MKGLAVLLIVVAGGLWVYVSRYDGSDAYMGIAVLCLALGVILFFVSAFIGKKKNDLMSQMSQMQQMQQFNTGPGATMGGVPVTGQASGIDVQNMMGMDAMAILQSVMEAQQQSGGDPDQMAKMLQDKFGGQSVVVDGDSQTTFNLTSQVFGSASNDSPSNDMLTS